MTTQVTPLTYLPPTNSLLGPKSFYVKRKGLQKAITRIRDGREQRQQRKKFREGRSEKDARILRKIKKTRLAE